MQCPRMGCRSMNTTSIAWNKPYTPTQTSGHANYISNSLRHKHPGAALLHLATMGVVKAVQAAHDEFRGTWECETCGHVW